MRKYIVQYTIVYRTNMEVHCTVQYSVQDKCKHCKLQYSVWEKLEVYTQYNAVCRTIVEVQYILEDKCGSIIHSTIQCIWEASKYNVVFRTNVEVYSSYLGNVSPYGVTGGRSSPLWPFAWIRRLPSLTKGIGHLHKWPNGNNNVTNVSCCF